MDIPIRHQPERVTSETREDMEVEVEDVLERCLAIGQKKVDTLASEPRLSDRGGNSLRNLEDVGAEVRTEVTEVRNVLFRDDHSVAGRE